MLHVEAPDTPISVRPYRWWLALAGGQRWGVDRLSAGTALLLLASASWLLLMWPMFRAGPLVLDEHGSYWIVDSDLPGTSLQRSLDYAAIPPLSSWMQQLFLQLLGKSEFTFRLPSALCAWGALLVTYAIGKHLQGEWAGGIAALLLIWHPEAMDETRIARCYGLILFLAAVVTLLAVRWSRRPASSRLALGWTLACAALLWTHYTSALLVLASWTGTLLCASARGALTRTAGRNLLAAGLVLALLCWPLLFPIVRLQEWGPYLNFGAPHTSLGDLFGPFWWAGLPAGLMIFWLCGQRSAMVSIWTCEFWLLCGCGLIPLVLLAILASGEMSSLANPRYRVAYAPAATCLVSLLLTARSARAAHAASLLAALAFLVSAWWWTPQLPWHPGRLNHAADQDWYELNQSLAGRAQAGEPILVQSGLTESNLVPAFADDPQFMEYVACRVSRFYVASTHPRIGLPFVYDPRTGIGEFYRDLLDSWPEGTVCWVACATDTDLNRNSLEGIRQIAEQLDYVADEFREWPRATLIRYIRRPTPAS